MEPVITYWINVNRPEMQYKTNGVSRWARKVTETNWKAHDGSPLTLPCDWRYVVTEQELADRPKQ